MSTAAAHVGLTKEEAVRYDRQIRLWGLAAQQKLRETRLLLHGFTSTSAELCKNVVLAGVQSVTVNDPANVVPRDLGAHLFLDAASVGKSRALGSEDRINALNPHVKIHLSEVPWEQLDLSQFDLVVCSGLSMTKLIEASDKARLMKVGFLVVDSFGMFGFGFEDLGELFQFEQTTKGNDGKEEKTSSTCTFVPFGNAMNVTPRRGANKLYLCLRVLLEFEHAHGGSRPSMQSAAEFMRLKNEFLAKHSLNLNALPDDVAQTFLLQLSTELAPVSAIIGGVMAQEVVKIICRNDKPFINSFFFSALDGSGDVVQLFSPH